MTYVSLSKPKSKPAAVGKKGKKRQSAPIHQKVNAEAGLGRFQIQPKLKIGEPNDKYEQEADQVADQVMRMPESQVQGKFEPIAATNGIQRMEMEEEEEMMQAKSISGTIQRMCTECEEEKLQRMEMEEDEEVMQTKQDGGGVSGVTATPSIQSGINRLRQGGGATLPESTRGFMEPRFGHDFSNVKIHTSPQAAELSRSVNARAFTVGQDIFFNQGEFQPNTPSGKRLLAHEMAHTLQQSHSYNTIRRSNGDEQYVPFNVHISQGVSKEKFIEIAEIQIYGNVIGSTWNNVKDYYDPSDSPVTVLINVDSFKKVKGYSVKEVGFELDETGSLIGAKERAKEFFNMEDQAFKEEVFVVIDERYWKALGIAQGEKIVNPQQEAGKIEIWNHFRDEVLAEHQFIKNLPQQLKSVIKFRTGGLEIRPKHYEQITLIAKKLMQMSDQQLSAYVNRVSSSTKNLKEFENSLEHFLSEWNRRKTEERQMENIETMLFDTDEIYKSYRIWKLYKRREPGGAQIMKQGIETELKQKTGFKNIVEFEQYIANYYKVFEQKTLWIAIDHLNHLKHILYLQEQYYKKPSNIINLMKLFEQYGIKDSDEQNAGDISKSVIQKIAEVHPMMGWDDKDLNLIDLANRDENSLQYGLLRFIKEKRSQIKKAKAYLTEDPETIYLLGQLVEISKQKQGIQPESVYDLLIKDKQSRIRIAKVVNDLVLAMIGLALGLITAGAGAIIAAGLNFGMSFYEAIVAVEEYKKLGVFADLNFVESNPELKWVLLAVVTAGFDLLSVAHAVKTLEDPIKQFGKTSNLAELEKTIKLEKYAHIDSRIKKAAVKALEAKTNFRRIQDKLFDYQKNRFFNVTDTHSLAEYAKLAYYASKFGIYRFEEFFLLLRQKRLINEVLSSEEMLALKAAFSSGTASKKVIVIKPKGVIEFKNLDPRTAGTGGIKIISGYKEPGSLETIVGIEGVILPPMPKRKKWEGLLRSPGKVGLLNYERAHLWGPGMFGDEAVAGVMYAPKRFNQELQARGIEDRIKQLRELGDQDGFEVIVKAEARSYSKGAFPSIKLRNKELILKHLEYKVFTKQGDKFEEVFRVSADVGHPPSGSVSVSVTPMSAWSKFFSF